LVARVGLEPTTSALWAQPADFIGVL